MPIKIHLSPPLNQAAGSQTVSLDLPSGGTLQAVIDGLIEAYGPQLRAYLYDNRDLVIPAWTVFINGQPVRLKRPENLAHPIQEGDDLYFILNIAGG
jgi:molybdopterin converting factor small subunit